MQPDDDAHDDLGSLRRRWYHEGFYGAETLGQLMAEGAARFPDSRMLFHGSARPATATLGEMFGRSARVAAGLRALGLGRGDVIAIQVPNWLEGAVTYQAATLLGAVVVPIIHIYGPAEVSFILRQSGARALVVPDRWRTIDYLERLDRLHDVPGLEHVIVIGDDGPSDVVRWSDLERVDAPPLAPTAGSPDEVCLLIYTSGTTADPKGVQHTHNTLAAEVRSTHDLLGRGAGAINLAAFPAGHIAGVLNVLRMFLFGNGSILMDQWDAVAAAELVAEHRVVGTSGAPFYLQSMLDVARERGLDLSSLRSYMVGATSVPPSLVEAADRAGVIAYRAYGSTEHPVLTTSTSADPLPKRALTDGRLAPGSELRIVDDDGHDVMAGADGEIACRGPQQFVGYRDPALDADAFLPGRWFRTGDVGRVDADGYLTITDRKKDIIIRGGENISSKEVEDILARHPAVTEAAVVGFPDPRYEERVGAFVIARPGAPLDLDDVRRHFAAAGVALQKTPERLELVDELPRGMSGKVKKFELRGRLS